MREEILKILKENDIDPDSILETENGEQTAYQYLEARVYGALDEIEDF